MGKVNKKEKEFKLGSISDVIAQSLNNEKPILDEKLCGIFNLQETKKKIKKLITKSPYKITQSSTSASTASTSKSSGKEKTKELKLSNNEAASIRVQAKSKISDQSPETKKIKNDFKDKKNKPSKIKESDEILTSSPPKKSAKNADDKKSHKELDAPKEKDPELESRTIFVGNVPKELKKSKLKSLFKSFGDIETIRFRGIAPAKPELLKKVAMRKKELHPDRATIFAYIRYKSRLEAEIAVRSMNGFEIEGHHLNVDLADNKEKQNKLAVFIGNLHIKVEEEEIRSVFKDCGPISSVRIVRDPATRIGKGFGYINFENAESVLLALKQDGTSIRNRAIRVQRSIKKPKTSKESKIKKSQGERKRLREQQSQPNKSTKGNAKLYSGDFSTHPKSKKKNKKNKGELRKAKFVKQLKLPNKSKS